MDCIRDELEINRHKRTAQQKALRAKVRRNKSRLAWILCRKEYLRRCWKDGPMPENAVGDPIQLADPTLHKLASLPDDAFQRVISMGIPVPMRDLNCLVLEL